MPAVGARRGRPQWWRPHNGATTTYGSADAAPKSVPPPGAPAGQQQQLVATTSQTGSACWCPCVLSLEEASRPLLDGRTIEQHCCGGGDLGGDPGDDLGTTKLAGAGHICWNNIEQKSNNNHSIKQSDRAKPGRFRFFVAFLVVCAIAINSYANYTMYIAAIGMISNDVISSGMTQLRAKHLSKDPLAADSNAASPGTCPVVARLAAELANANYMEMSSPSSPPAATWSSADNSSAAKLNTTAASQGEQQAMALDTIALLADVEARLANGQLVDWTIDQRGLIFTAHTIGGILVVLPINRLGLIYGPKTMISICISVAAARMWLLPLLAGHAPFWLMFVFELTMGAPGACVGILAYPIAAAWLLPDEANFFVALAQFATIVGNAMTNFVTTQLLANQIDWSWCYYLPGKLIKSGVQRCQCPFVCAPKTNCPPSGRRPTIGTTHPLLMASGAILSTLGVLWLVLGADRPEMSRFVSSGELRLLEDSLAKRNEMRLLLRSQQEHHLNGSTLFTCICARDQQINCPANKLNRRPNWTVIFTCPTIWALVAVYFAYHWNAKIATMWPTYFANILHLDAATIGMLTGLKGIVALLFGSAFAFVTRKFAVTRPFNISLTAYRRLNQVFATLSLAVSVALMVLMDCDVWANFVSVILTPVVNSFNAISHEQMPLDLSAEDSGLLVSVIRLLSIGDIPALPASSYILSYAPNALAGDRPTWRAVWLLGLAIKMTCCLVFVMVAKSEPKSYSRLEPSGACKTALKLGDHLHWPVGN